MVALEPCILHEKSSLCLFGNTEEFSLAQWLLCASEPGVWLLLCQFWPFLPAICKESCLDYTLVSELHASNSIVIIIIFKLEFLAIKKCTLKMYAVLQIDGNKLFTFIMYAHFGHLWSLNPKAHVQNKKKKTNVYDWNENTSSHRRKAKSMLQ